MVAVVPLRNEKNIISPMQRMSLFTRQESYWYHSVTLPLISPSVSVLVCAVYRVHGIYWRDDGKWLPQDPNGEDDISCQTSDIIMFPDPLYGSISPMGNYHR